VRIATILLVLAANFAVAFAIYHRPTVMPRPARASSPAQMVQEILEGPKSQCAQQHKAFRPIGTGIKWISPTEFEFTFQCEAVAAH